MNTKPLTHAACKALPVPLVTVSAEDQARRVDQAVAKRAYQIFEKRGGMAWHELEDWRQAESELQGNLCISRTTEDHTLVISTDPAGFAPGSLEIWVAPTRLTVSGEWHPRRINCVAGRTLSPFHHIYHAVELPYPVDPARATACIHNQFLEIKLPQAVAAPQTKHAGAA